MSSFVNSVAALLTEAYAGPPDPTTTWFIDNEPDSGILGILSRVSAAEASVSVDGSDKPGTTIAANTEHLRWDLEHANAYLQGQTAQGDWKTSWELVHVDDAEWDRLRANLRAEYETAHKLILAQKDLQDLSEPDVTGLMAEVAHAAYHLGTIRQMVERVRQG